MAGLFVAGLPMMFADHPSVAEFAALHTDVLEADAAGVNGAWHFVPPVEFSASMAFLGLVGLEGFHPPKFAMDVFPSDIDFIRPDQKMPFADQVADVEFFQVVLDVPGVQCGEVVFGFHPIPIQDEQRDFTIDSGNDMPVFFIDGIRNITVS